MNKTPLLPESNRQIGGEAPSIYSKRVMRKAEIDEVEYRSRVESHLVDYSYFIVDDFDGYFIARAKAIMKAIEAAMGKSIAETWNLRGSVAMGIDYYVLPSLYIGAQIDALAYSYNMTTYKPQEGLSNLDADSHSISALAAPTLKVGIKFWYTNDINDNKLIHHYYEKETYDGNTAPGWTYDGSMCRW